MCDKCLGMKRNNVLQLNISGSEVSLYAERSECCKVATMDESLWKVYKCSLYYSFTFLVSLKVLKIKELEKK